METVTPKEAAKILGLTRQRVQQLVKDETLKNDGKFGSTTKIRLSSVKKLKAKRNGCKPKSRR